LHNRAARRPGTDAEGGANKVVAVIIRESG